MARQRHKSKSSTSSARIPSDMIRRASKKQRDELRAHGFRTTNKGLVIDGPRDRRREKISGAKTEILKGGVVKFSVGQRRDFIYGFTRKEKKEYAKDPEAFEKKKIRELMDQFPSLRRRKKQVRLQWGSYQGTKNFAASYFTAKYFSDISGEERSTARRQKRRAQPRIDKLTGFHIVIHVADKPKRRKKK